MPRSKWVASVRRAFRVTHRDIGYFFFTMSVVYALSGLAMNHARDWNPDYVVTHETVSLERSALPKGNVSREDASQLLLAAGVTKAYRQHFRPEEGKLKIFFDGGTMLADEKEGIATIEALERRAVFHFVNRLHRNPGRAWTWFSDLFSLSLLILAVTGLFILPGKNGIGRRGGVLALAGFLVPLIIVMVAL